jgi:probable phosphoglycerate mutase
MGNVIYFVRHGETFWNVENKICGATDIALTQKGHEQAEAAGRMIKEKMDNGEIEIHRIYCSPLIRAADTARHIADITGIPLTVELRLIEQRFGRFEGTARNVLEFKESKKHFADSYDGGESMLRLGQRIYNLLDELKEKEEESGETYLLVAHNGIARMVTSYFCDMTNDEFASAGIGNCELKKFELR